MASIRCLYKLPWRGLTQHSRSKWKGIQNILLRQMGTIQQEHILKSPYPDVSIFPESIMEYTWKNLSSWQNKICIECAITGRKYTYAEARDRSRRFAVSLQKMGLKHNDVIAVILPNIPEYPLILLGSLEAGVVFSSINPIYKAAEIAKHVKDCNARCVVTDSARYSAVEEALKQNNMKLPIISVGSTDIPTGTIDFQMLIDKTVDMSELVSGSFSPTETAILPYSSGTTGFPKGVMLTHKNIVSNMYQLNDPRVCLTSPALGDHQEVLPAILPFFHIYGMIVILIAKLAQGAKIITLPRFEPSIFIDMLTKHKATGLYLAPPLVLFLATFPNATPEILNAVRFIMSGAAPLGGKDVERLLEKIPDATVIQGYGMTETSPVLTQGVKGITDYASVGPCLANTCGLVLDPDGNSLGAGEHGEVCFKGPQIMKGYLNNPKATEEMIDSNGYIHTGDIGYYDDKQNFYIVDRVKELIKVKGFQVPPAELEELIRSHPHVLDAAVKGMPDERSGEVPKAYVVPRPGVTASEKDIIEFVKSRVASYKHLAGGVEFVDNIPKNSAGKILRRQLK